MSDTTHVPAPKIAATFVERDNTADLSPRLVGERWPRDLNGNAAGPELLAARENWIEKTIPILLAAVPSFRPASGGASFVASLAKARAGAAEAFDLIHNLTMAETPAEIAFRVQRVESAKIASEVQARMAKARLESAAKIEEIKIKWPQLASESIETYRRRIWDKLDAISDIHTKGNLAPFNPNAVGL
jgi:hypothetical protein